MNALRASILTGLLVLAGCTHPSTPTVAHGEPVAHWVRMLQAPDAQARKKAVRVLGNVGPVDPAVVPALAGAVKDADTAVRTEAVLALVKIGPPARDALPALTDATHDPDPTVRAYAARAIERVGSKD